MNRVKSYFSLILTKSLNFVVTLKQWGLPFIVIPAEAGIQAIPSLDSRFRGNDYVSNSNSVRSRIYKKISGRPVKIFFIIISALVLGSGIAFGWPWSHDLDYHPSYDTQESPMDPPPHSLPRDGKEKIMTREEADKSLGNPVILSEESVKKGEEFFKIYCAACHGPGGKGDGPVAPKFFPPPNLGLPLTQGRTDGYIYGTITYGGTVMPGYRAALSPEDRWHVVNYVRSLKGK